MPINSGRASRQSAAIVAATSMMLMWACYDLGPIRAAFCAAGDAGPPSNYVFVTSVKVAPGSLGGADSADAICQGLADHAGLRGGYRAWLPASSTESALSRLQGARGWIRSDGRPSIDRTTDNGATGKSLHPPILTEKGTPIPFSDPVFTGTDLAGGISLNNCQFWTKGTDDAGTAVGYPYLTTPGTWTNFTEMPCSIPARFYCFGTNLDTPLNVPPPSSARRAFITTTSYAPGDGGLPGADALCQDEALAAGLPGTYLAFIGRVGQSEGSRFDADGGTWYRVDNIPIAATPGEWFKTDAGRIPLATLNLTADGGRVDAYVWTGAACSDWMSTSGYGFVGVSDRLDAYYGHYVVSCSSYAKLYCLQQ